MTIKELRTITGLSQRAFGEKYHIPTRTIENWESGSRKPNDTILYLLERAVREDYNMVYVIIDDCLSRKAAIFDERFDTKEEAIQTAEAEWKSFTERDKNSRDAYYVATCTIDEDGDLDWESINPIIEFK